MSYAKGYDKKEYMKMYYRNNKHKWFKTPEQRRTIRKTWPSVIQNMVDHARHRAKRDNREFSITKADIVIPEKCPILNEKLIPGDKRLGPSLDRVDNTRGYTKDNIRVISKKANHLKGAATIEQLKTIISYMEKHK